MSIHIIEENAAVRLMLAGLLESMGFEVRAFGEVLHYLSYAESCCYMSPALLMADLRSSRLVGRPQALTLCRRFRDLPWVMMTPAPDMQSMLRHCVVLSKPFRPEAVQDALERCGIRPVARPWSGEATPGGK